MQVLQVNQQTGIGGGEYYTAFLTRHLEALGVHTVLLTDPRAGFWSQLQLPDSTRVVSGEQPLLDAINSHNAPLWILGHGPVPVHLLEQAGHWRRQGRRCWVTAIAHMPVQGRNPRAFDGHDMVFPVSRWVMQGLLEAGVPTWRSPLYGVADLSRFNGAQDAARRPVYRASTLEPDLKKPRDRVLKRLERWSEPLMARLAPAVQYHKRPGLTLGVVSRLATIKQFPTLFNYLVPVLQRFPSIYIDVFGAGGYASVRDLKQVVKPLGDRVRFWGAQRDVEAVYHQIDALLLGLPEKEALGLNVLEATVCGVPVLAVNAPPFTETVLPGVNGYYYEDPRKDGGASVEALLKTLLSNGATLPHSDEQKKLLALFTDSAFAQRVAQMVHDGSQILLS